MAAVSADAQALECTVECALPAKRDGEARSGIAALLAALGEDPERAGLRDTPARVVRAFHEMTRGYGMDPAAILERQFDEPYDEMIVLKNVEFTSLCEHHLLPFQGVATVAYIPGPQGKIVGLSKLARLVDCYAMRLQVQERLTQQIAVAIDEHLQAAGVGVVLKAKHLCMGCRGVKKPAAEMVTSYMLGAMKGDKAARAELLSLAM